VGLAVVVAGYLALGAAYALRTPLWQVPDEPAHYNYVAQVAESGPDPPEIEAGDYPFERLERLKAERFPPGASVAGIEYEDHQPPAYYYLAAVVYRAAGGTIGHRVHAIRLLGVALGLVTVLCAAYVARLLAPGSAGVALGAAGMAAFLPMSLTMTAAVNNDPLAHALAAVLVAVATRFAMRGGTSARYTALAGLVLGLALWTKLTVYPLAIPVAAAGALGAGVAGAGNPSRLRAAAGPVALAGLLGAPWFARNMLAYAPTDPLGLARHGAVVTDQPRTSAWIASVGLGPYLSRLAGMTFRSFWGVFGWMGVFMEPWVYGLLAVASLLIVLGAALAARESAGEPAWRRGGTILATTLGVTVAAFLVYNVDFVQQQGRYLFPALVPIAVGAGLAWHTLGRRLGAAVQAVLTRLDRGRQTIAARPSAGGSTGRLPAIGAEVLPVAFVIALALLATVSLSRYIVPWLTPGGTGDVGAAGSGAPTTATDLPRPSAHWPEGMAVRIIEGRRRSGRIGAA
jgi:hypothetical protein